MLNLYLVLFIFSVSVLRMLSYIFFLQVLGIIKQELSKTQEPRPTDVLALALVILDRGSPEQVC